MFQSVRTLAVAAGLALAPALSANAASIVFSDAGPDAASIADTVDAFRAQLGEPNNANTPGSQPTGRREINWDGGGDAAPATQFPTPMTTFASRGNVNTTPGTGFEISGQPLPEFGDINPTYPDIFTTFSSPRLFAPLGSNVLDVLFTIPGTTDEPAVSSGFGAVFTDVDLAATTLMEFFDPLGASLGTFAAPVFDQGLSFLGVFFDDTFISRVRITLGNSALGPNDGAGTDVVALDDFVYGEPQEAAAPIAEPATLAMLAAGLASLVLLVRRRTAS